LLVVAGLWLANLSLGPLDNYDSALYHLQAVRWAEDFPAVPGIGNLDGPLAFNNSYSLFSAMLSVGPWQGRANHLANGLLVLVFLGQSIIAGARLLAGEREPGRLFDFLLLAAVASRALNGGVSNFGTDLGASLLLLVSASLLYTKFLSLTAESDDRSYSLIALVVLLAAAVTFKTNAGPFAAVGFLLAVFFWLSHNRGRQAQRVRTLGWALTALVLYAGLWMGRGVVLSGYPLFPTSFAGFPVEWRVPTEHADAEFAYIVHSGRASTQNLPVVAGEAGLSSWIPRWTQHALDNPYDLAVPLGLALLGTLAYRVRRHQATAKRSDFAGGWWLLLPIGVSVAAWFSVAPEPRYALPHFWLLAALCWSQRFRLQSGSIPLPNERRLVAIGVVLGISPLLVNPVFSREFPDRHGNPVVAILKANLNRPGQDRWLQPIEGKPVLSTYRTQSGLLLNTVPERCWDAPLPCTPNPAPNLRARDPANLAKGFVVDGDWQMENWPMSWQPDFLQAWRRSRARPHQ